MTENSNSTFLTPTACELIRFSGVDALAFLDALTTNALQPVAAGGATRMTGFCTPKGRLLALFRVWARAGEICARVPRGMAAAILPKLQTYVLRARVDMEGPVEDMGTLGLAGTEAEAFLRRYDVSVPEQPATVTTAGDFTVLRTGLERFEIIGAAPRIDRFLAQADVRRAEPDDWERLEIRAGIPEIYPQTMDEFIPQMLGLEALDAVSFRKGCYPGQEIIARIQSRGSVKRHMHRARAAGNSAIEAGADVFDAGGSVAGTVVRAALDADGASRILLAVVSDSARESELRLADGAGLEFPKDDHF